MAAPKQDKGIQAYATGVNVVTISAGDGKSYPKKGDNLVMHYTGTFHGGPKHGYVSYIFFIQSITSIICNAVYRQKFDSSVDKGRPFKFQIGVGRVIKGWDEGVLKMSKGEKAILQISWEYGYGAKGYPGVIPARQDLRFEVQLLEIN